MNVETVDHRANWLGFVLVWIQTISACLLLALAVSETVGAATKSIVGEQVLGRFGSSVAVLGDINENGTPDIAVASSGYGSSSTVAIPKVLVLDGGSNSVSNPVADIRGTYSETGDLKDTGFNVGKFFEFTISVGHGGDLNADGKPDLVIGSRGLGLETGYTYMYSGDGSFIRRFLYVAHSHPQGVGDYNGDGYDDVATGYPRWQWGYGAANIKSGRKIYNENLLIATGYYYTWQLDAAAGLGNFARSKLADGRDCPFHWDCTVELTPDGMGLEEIAWSTNSEKVNFRETFNKAVGARVTAYSATSIPAPYYTSREVWTKRSADFGVYYPQRDNNWGTPIISVSDIDGDGVKDLIIGAQPMLPQDMYGRSDVEYGYFPTYYSDDWGHKDVVGIVRVLSGKSGDLIQEFSLGNKGDLFGYAVAAADYNGDGKLDVIAGAPGVKNASGCAIGKVYVLDIGSGQTLAEHVGDEAGCPHNSLDFSTDPLFGMTVAGSGKQVIVGEPGFDNGDDNDVGRVVILTQ